MRERTVTKGRWKLEVTESHGGGPFELEVRRRFDVVDLKTGECILHFRGEDDFSLSTSGRGWESNSASGVKEVTLESDGLIVSYAQTTVRYQLPLRELRTKELLELNPFFEAFQRARRQYWYEMDWSSDVSIPGEAIRESHREMMRAWEALEGALRRLGIRDMVYGNLKLPKRIRGGRKQVEGLLEWLKAERHRWSTEQVSRSR